MKRYECGRGLDAPKPLSYLENRTCYCGKPIEAECRACEHPAYRLRRPKVAK